jgi:bacterioferritin (cytochrome b1)
MSSSDTITVLNRVLEILERSFPQYMRWARPYIPPGREGIMQTINEIVTGQDALAERVSQHIFESSGLPDHGDFPVEFTDTHDLSIDFLLQEAIDCTRQDISDLEQCVDALRSAPTAQFLASEALGMTKGHLELLEKQATGGAASTKLGPTPMFANDAPVSKEAAGVPHRQEERKTLAGEPNSAS